MLIEHKRIANIYKPASGRAYCIAHVYINGVYSHDTIEDYDRGLDESMSATAIARKKVMHQTAIPTGHYRVRLDIVSPTFGAKAYYRAFCGGRLPRLDPVKGFSGVLLHRGTDERNSSGCPIVGLNTIVGAVTHSQEVFERLYKQMMEADARGEDIDYIITRSYKA